MRPHLHGVDPVLVATLELGHRTFNGIADGFSGDKTTLHTAGLFCAAAAANRTSHLMNSAAKAPLTNGPVPG